MNGSEIELPVIQAKTQEEEIVKQEPGNEILETIACLLYTSDAADE